MPECPVGGQRSSVVWRSRSGCCRRGHGRGDPDGGRHQRRWLERSRLHREPDRRPDSCRRFTVHHRSGSARGRVPPDGRFAYVANQGDDDISRFSVADDAQLTPLGTTPTGANQPAGLTVSADGSLLMASNRDGTDTAPRVSVFNIDAATGGLTAVTGSPFNVGIFDPRASS
ncbi:MAG: beta-propeller fold lactonase family protein [Solirubrobacterales bacterium]